MSKKGSKGLSIRILVTIILVLIGIGLTALIYIIPLNSETGMTWIERLYYSVQIVVAIYVVVGAVVGIWQYCVSTRSEIIKNETDKVKQAVDLAGYYKDHIINAFLPIRYVYKQIGALDIFNSINTMVEFDSEELKQNLNEKQISDLKRSIEDSKLVTIVKEAGFIYNLNFIESSLKWQENFGSIKPISEDLKLKTVQNFLINQITTLLNNMEYFSMYFTYNIADESVVFQSLHQTFFEMVETL